MDKINLKAVLLQNMGEDSADFLPIMGDEKELLNDNCLLYTSDAADEL